MNAIQPATPTGINPFDLPVHERARFYQRELALVTPPKTFREELLSNVYRCLLEQCSEQRRQAA